ncbi:MAG: hypothetical protein QOF51_2367 [Chloroflexota bacterium]|jgi:hypothetical protein|nr:hypothetical protein [Chloroflexota bacterium]
MLRKLSGIFGVVLLTIGLPFVAMALHDVITGDSKTERGVLLGLVVLFGAMSFWGFKLAASAFNWQPFWPQLRAPKFRVRTGRQKEQAVLALAAAVGGRVTMVEVAAKCNLTIDEADAILHNLAARHAVEMLIADDGTIVYDFEILSRSEKARAKEFG